MQTNERGQVAVKYYQTIPHILSVGQTNYAFSVKQNICLAWVEPGQVSTVLGITKTCCGGNKKPVYFLCNELDVRLWSGLGR